MDNLARMKPEKDRGIESYLQYLKVERDASPHTITAYRIALYEFTRFIGSERPLASCQPGRLPEILARLHAKEVEPILHPLDVRRLAQLL
jgi:site-specific recombinase XerD